MPSVTMMQEDGRVSQKSLLISGLSPCREVLCLMNVKRADTAWETHRRMEEPVNQVGSCGLAHKHGDI